MSRNSSRRRLFSYVILLCWTAFVLFPFYSAVITSFKDGVTIYAYPPTYMPFLQFTPSIIGWSNALNVGYLSPFWSSYGNSLIVGIGASLLSLGLGLPAAYALARFKFRRPMNNDGIAFWILSFRMFPQAVFVVPFLYMFGFMGLFDNQIALILADTVFALPLVVWMLREFIVDLPIELEESALIDGAGRGTLIRHIVLPLIVPGVVVALVLAFIFTWNELFFSVVLTSTKAVTGAAFLLESFSDVDFLLFMIPPLVLGFVIQKYIARGLTFGAVKG